MSRFKEACCLTVTIGIEKAKVLSYLMSAQQRLRSDMVKAKADLSLHGAQSPLFCHATVNLRMNSTGETVVPQKKKTYGLKIYHRFHFSSALKRMSVIAGHTTPGSMETEYIGTVKGAPETLKPMV